MTTAVIPASKTTRSSPAHDPSPDSPGEGRIRRLICLVNLVHEGSARSASELSVELGVTRRTIFRDIKTLQEAGVEIFSRPGGGYSLASHFTTSSHSLTGEELVGLIILARMAEAAPKSPPMRAAANVLRRILGHMPKDVRHACEYEARAHLETLRLTDREGRKD